MKDEFEMLDLRKLTYFFLYEIHLNKCRASMHQKKYAGEFFRRFNMNGCNSVVTPIEVKAKLKKGAEENPLDNTLSNRLLGH